MESGNEDITLAFEYAALTSLKHPDTVLKGCRQWATYIGVLSNEPTYVVTGFTRQLGFSVDFFSGPRTLKESLPKIRVQPELSADRYILIGLDDTNEEEANRQNWEFLTLEAAAEAADWEITIDEPGTQMENESSGDTWP